MNKEAVVYIYIQYYMYQPYYPAIKKNTFESVLVKWMNLEVVIQSEVSKRKTNIVYYIYAM